MTRQEIIKRLEMIKGEDPEALTEAIYYVGIIDELKHERDAALDTAFAALKMRSNVKAIKENVKVEHLEGNREDGMIAIKKDSIEVDKWYERGEDAYGIEIQRNNGREWWRIVREGRNG